MTHWSHLWLVGDILHIEKVSYEALLKMPLWSDLREVPWVYDHFKRNWGKSRDNLCNPQHERAKDHSGCIVPDRKLTTMNHFLAKSTEVLYFFKNLRERTTIIAMLGAKRSPRADCPVKAQREFDELKRSSVANSPISLGNGSEFVCLTCNHKRCYQLSSHSLGNLASKANLLYE